MKKGQVVVFIIVLVLIAGIAIYFLANNANIQAVSNSVDDTSNQDIKNLGLVNLESESANSDGNKVYIIEMNEAGFSPKILEIKKGSQVKFINTGQIGQWPASAMHPTHTIYPGSDTKKCGTDKETEIFDACRNISPGESWSFTFNEKGEWGYHDHSNSVLFGKIIVG